MLVLFELLVTWNFIIVHIPKSCVKKILILKTNYNCKNNLKYLNVNDDETQ